MQKGLHVGRRTSVAGTVISDTILQVSLVRLLSCSMSMPISRHNSKENPLQKIQQKQILNFKMLPSPNMTETIYTPMKFIIRL